ncbi:hypothetical protein RUM43_011062 [Polyplax serrata]|uniref:FAM21/CAPZIP domain-containing protein n=1 Tax=Polyplax serrata TaxID=468196 RepID=A0AAN8PEL9_POLSC
MDGGNKKATKVISTNDIRKQACNWTLAGDAGLLAHLEQFSEKICTKTQDTHLKFNELVESYEELHKNIENVTNEFLSLQNCQFVENRVYDDETPIEENSNEKVVDEEEKERLLLLQYKEAVDIGIKLLDTHFQEVEVPPNSDSDDEDEEDMTTRNVSVIWKPKNPYAGKKFPLLIGSVEWWEDDKVGLGEFDENTVEEKEITDSDTDEEKEAELGKHIQISSSSSENERSIPIPQNNFSTSGEDIFGIDKSSMFNRSSPDIFGSDSVSEKSDAMQKSSDFENSGNSKAVVNEEETTVLPEHTDNNINRIKKVDNDFVKELASKLRRDNATITAKEKTTVQPIVPNVEKEIIKSTESDNLFTENDDSDLFSESSIKVPEIDTKSLFDDTENDTKLFGESKSLFTDKNLFSSTSIKSPKLAWMSNENDIKHKEALPVVPKEDTVNDLFGDLDDEENDSLFFSKSITKKSLPSVESDIFNESSPSSLKRGSDTNVPRSKGLFDDDSDDTDESSIFDTGHKKERDLKISPVEKVDEPVDNFPTLFQSNVRTDQILDKPSRSDCAENGPVVTRHSNLVNRSGTELTFGTNDEKTELFDEDFPDESKVIPPTKLTLGLEDDDTSLFSEKPKNADALSISSTRSSLFGDIPTSKTHLASLFGHNSNKLNDELLSATDNILFGGSIFGQEGYEEDLFSKKSTPAVKNDDKSDLFSTKSKDAVKGSYQSDVWEQSNATLGEETKSDLFSTKSYITKRQGNNLFDDFDDSDDLFGETKVTKDNFLNDSLFQVSSANPLKKSPLAGSLPEAVERSNTVNNDEVNSDVTVKNIDSLTENGIQKELPKLDSLLDEVRVPVPESHMEPVSKESGREVASESIDQTDKSKQVNEIENDLFENKNSSMTKEDIYKETLPSGAKNSFSEGDKVPTNFVVPKPKPPDSLNVQKHLGSGESNNSKTRKVKKLNIPDHLKSKLESVVHPTSSVLDVIKEAKNKKPLNLESENTSENVEEPFEHSTNLLQCPSKNRAKIPIRRRPQSRRARHEAIRNSGLDFQTNQAESSTKESSANKSSIIENDIARVSESREPELRNPVAVPISPSPKSHPLSPLTDEEDIFNVPDLDRNFEKDDHNLFKSNLLEVGNSVDLDDNLIFNAAPVLSPHLTSKDEVNITNEPSVKNSKSDNLFNFDEHCLSDDNDNDNLFKVNILEKSSKNPLSNAKEGKTFEIDRGIRKPLFDMEADKDDDDLFGENFMGKPSLQAPPEKIPEVSKVKNESKGKNKQAFVDPLGLISNDEE